MYENVGPSNGNSVSTHICCIGEHLEKKSITNTLTFKGGKFVFQKWSNSSNNSVGGGWGANIEWKIQIFLRPSHTYISMLPLSTTWAGGHSKTNIPDIMYISDFYSSSFLHADHENY